MKSFLKWFAGFFEEEPGVASSKRLVYIAGSAVSMVIAFKLSMMGKYDLIAIGSYVALIQGVSAGTYLVGQSQENKKQ